MPETVRAWARVAGMGALSISLALPTMVFAQSRTLSIDGAFGNEAGCRFHKDPSAFEESLQLLTPDGWRTYVSSCSWVQVLPGEGAEVAISLCGYEGGGEMGSDMFVVAPDTSDPKVVHVFSNREGGGDLTKCE